MGFPQAPRILKVYLSGLSTLPQPCTVHFVGGHQLVLLFYMLSPQRHPIHVLISYNHPGATWRWQGSWAEAPSKPMGEREGY